MTYLTKECVPPVGHRAGRVRGLLSWGRWTEISFHQPEKKMPAGVGSEGEEEGEKSTKKKKRKKKRRSRRKNEDERVETGEDADDED